MTSDLTFRRSHHHHQPPAASYYHLKFIRQLNFYKHLSSIELKMNWPECIQSQLRSSTSLFFDETYFFALLPAPASRKPFANGLLSIFSWVIWKVFVILKLADLKIIRKFSATHSEIICYFSAKIFHHDFKWSAVISDSPCFWCYFGEGISWLWFRVWPIIYWCIFLVC